MGWGRGGQDGSGCPQSLGRADPRAGGGGGEDPTPAAFPMLRRRCCSGDVGIARGLAGAATARVSPVFSLARPERGDHPRKEGTGCSSAFPALAGMCRR